MVGRWSVNGQLMVCRWSVDGRSMVGRWSLDVWLMRQLKMIPGVFNLNYLSFYLGKYKKKGQTLLFEFGQVEAEILPKNKLPSYFVDTVYMMADRNDGLA